jgi:hypothetical protein
MTKLARKLEELFVDMTLAEDRAFNPAWENLRMERPLNTVGPDIALKDFQSLAPAGHG